MKCVFFDFQVCKSQNQQYRKKARVEFCKRKALNRSSNTRMFSLHYTADAFEASSTVNRRGMVWIVGELQSCSEAGGKYVVHQREKRHVTDSVHGIKPNRPFDRRSSKMWLENKFH